MSDSESARPRSPQPPRRYSKRPLRGPYGQMLEAEMQRPEPRIHSRLQSSEDLKFLEELAAPRPQPPATRPPSPCPTPPPPQTGARRKVAGPAPCHQRAASSPSQLEGYQRPPADQEAPSQQIKDMRTHVVVEILETERSYVESLSVLVHRYLRQLTSPENAGLVDPQLVNDIFYQIPSILSHHEHFLENLQKKLDAWDSQQTIGDVFNATFTSNEVIDAYTSFINNWKTAREAVKATCQAKPAFAKFLEAMAREHKGKLALDSLLIMPVQRIPRYELLLQTLIKNTDPSHPDYERLLQAQQVVHVLAVKINCTERETMEAEQQQAVLRELENMIEGCMSIALPDRTFLRYDVVTVIGDAAGAGSPERGLFLFSDMLIVTTMKRRSGAIRKPSTILPSNLIQQLEGNKHRFCVRLPLEDIEIIKLKDDVLKELIREVENLTEDAVLLTQLGDIAARLHSDHCVLDDVIREMLCYVNKQLSEHNGSESKLSQIELIIGSDGGSTETLLIIFSSQDKKTEWEEMFNDAKQKHALSTERRGSPEFVLPLPIRKTRAGLQFTCAAPTLSSDARDVWVCNSDGYVGQVCVLSLSPEPTVVSCNGVCNARILCIASVPAIDSGRCEHRFGHGTFLNSKISISISVEDADEGNIPDDSSSSSDGDYETEECLAGDDDSKNNMEDTISAVTMQSEVSAPVASGSEDSDSLQPTMWLGTEDGCIHVYNCTDNIRIKKNKIKIQHGSSVHCIIYLDNKVFVSLANGDITVYTRDSNGGWNTTDPLTVGIGTAAMPVTRMLSIGGKLWCGCQNTIKILNTVSLNIEHSFQVHSDSSRSVTCLALAGFGVWISLQNSAVIKLFHAISYECLCDVNVAPAVTKMLQSCDDIIRQHKAACLRVTSLLACKDLLWIGTSAGVILNMRLPHVTPSTNKVTTLPSPTGMPHGHTGHVRFLTCVETGSKNVGKESTKQQTGMFARQIGRGREGSSSKSTLLVISGGDGYEDFRTSGVSEVAGREDSTNHLLLWLV